jgi:L-2-hydroxyglutarate oxidase LhgO
MSSLPAPDIETAVIGGGVIGLAIAAECARAGEEVFVFERQRTIGQEITSRSSEVIHAGLYYPRNSLKARMCVEGRRLLYAYARNHNVAAKMLGKLVVATTAAETAALDAIAANAAANGVKDLKVLSAEDSRASEPEIAAVKALFSPSTGIVDSHGLMQALDAELAALGGTVVLDTSVQAVKSRDDGRLEVIASSGGEATTFTAGKLYAAAGLGMAELGDALPRAGSYVPPPLYFAKGHYYSLRGRSPFRHLVYPVPVAGGLGTHLTLDIDGNARFGPDVEWIDRIDYSFNDARGERRAEFERAIRTYWPALPEGGLGEAYTGIRPKTSRKGEPARDFEIHGPREHGTANLVALYGIESPGLTSSLAIARHCRNLLR